MIYRNLPNQINHVFLLGRVSKEMELKVQAPFLTHPCETKYYFGGVPFSMSRGRNMETREK